MKNLKKLLCLTVFSSLFSIFTVSKTCAMEENFVQNGSVQSQDSNEQADKSLEYDGEFHLDKSIRQYIRNFVHSEKNDLSCGVGIESNAAKGITVTECVRRSLTNLLMNYLKEMYNATNKNPVYDSLKDWVWAFKRCLDISWELQNLAGSNNGPVVGKLFFDFSDKNPNLKHYIDAGFKERLDQICEVYKKGEKAKKLENREIHNMYVITNEFLNYINENRSKYLNGKYEAYNEFEGPISEYYDAK